MISSGWVSPEFSWGDMRFLQLGGYDPSIQAINNPEIVLSPQVVAQPTTQNCACLTGQPYIENEVCKCTDVLQPPTENKPIFIPQRKPREIIDFNYAPTTAGQGINPLFLIGGAIVLVLLLKN